MADQGMSDVAAPRLLASLRSLLDLAGAGLRRRLALAALLMLLGAAAELVTIGAVMPFLALLVAPDAAAGAPGVGLLMRVAGAETSAGLVGWAVLLLSLAALVAAAARLFILRHTTRLTLDFGHRLGRLLFHHLLHQPYAAHLRRNPSELLAGVEKVQLVTGALLMPLMNAAVASVTAAALLALLIALEPGAATLAAATAALGYLIVARIAGRMLGRNSRVLAGSAVARLRLLQEAIGGMREILLGRTQPGLEARYAEIDIAFRRAQAANIIAGQAPRFLLEALAIIAMGALALYFASRPGGLVAAIPVLGVIALGAQRLLPLLQQIYAGWSQAVGNLQAVGDIIALLEAPVAAPAPLPPSVTPFERTIRFDAVCFRYAPHRPALSDLSLVIAKGARVGLVGRSGSGKSTFIDLLTGLLPPSSGRILIDDAPLTEALLPNWQAQVAVVPQDIYLADRSIAENIAFGAEQDAIDLARVREAAGAAAIHTFIESLPDGYATLAGERGVALSGGQRQRIAIARALYRRANLLIFDEATSALDRETEAEIMAAVVALGPDITVLLVSHRESSLAGCDTIIRLEAGRVAAVQMGPGAARRRA
jgi:ATP-binding cassette, subfamily B, bacterial PglK